MNAFQMIARDMGINLGRCDIGMAQKFLDNTQVRPAFKQMRCEGMAEGVRRQGLLNARKGRVFFDRLPEKFPRETPPAAADKKMIGERFLF